MSSTAIICGGTVGIVLSNSGALLNTSAVNINGQLTLVNSQSGLNRINDNATIGLHSGTLSLTSSSRALTETAGDTTLVGGGNVLKLTQQTSVATNLALGNLVRSNHATLSVQASTLYQAGAPGEGLSFTNASSFLIGGGGNQQTTTVSVIPFAIENSNTFSPRLLTAAGDQLRPLAENEYLTDITQSTADNNVQLAASTSINSNTAVNSLLNTSYTLSGNAVLSVHSGLIAGNGTISCPVDFGSREGMIFATRVSGPIAGTGGVSYDYLNFASPITITATNTYSGPTTINDGTIIISASVQLNAAGPFGSDSSAITLSAGNSAAVLNTPVAINFGRDLVIDSTPDTRSIYAPYLLGRFTVTGTTTLNGPLRIAFATMAGKITGPGSLVSTTGQNSVFLDGDNDYAGGTILRSGSLSLGSNTALGSGTLAINGTGTLSAYQQPRSLSNAIFFDPSSGGATLNFSSLGPTLSFSGPVDLGTGSATIAVNNTGGGTLSNTLSNGALTKFGSGTLYVGRLGVAALNLYAGTTQLLPGNAVSQSGTISFANGGNIDISNDGLVEAYVPGDNPASAIPGQIQTKYIFSSSSVIGTTAVGWADNATLKLKTFDGQAVTSQAILFCNTYLGDCNLDGKVDITDLGILATNWQQSGTWQNGDFDYSGKIDIADLGALATNWQAGVTSPSGISFDQALAEVGLGADAVPEPATLAATGLVLLSFSRQRSAWML